MRKVLAAKQRHKALGTWPGAPPLQGQIDVKSLYPEGLSVCLLFTCRAEDKAAGGFPMEEIIFSPNLHMHTYVRKLS